MRTTFEVGWQCDVCEGQGVSHDANAMPQHWQRVAIRWTENAGYAHAQDLCNQCMDNLRKAVTKPAQVSK